VRGKDFHPNVHHVAKDPDKLGRDGEGGKGVGVLDHIIEPAIELELVEQDPMGNPELLA
jgi:hypothetical protein